MSDNQSCTISVLISKQIIMNNNSGLNTLLIVIVLILIVGFGVWYFNRGTAGAPAEEPDASLNLNLDGGTKGE